MNGLDGALCMVHLAVNFSFAIDGALDGALGGALDGGS